MKSLSSGCLSRAEKVLAIQKAVREGSYEIDSTKLANKLVIHLLNLPTPAAEYRLRLKATKTDPLCLLQKISFAGGPH